MFGLELTIDAAAMRLEYGPGVYGPPMAYRRLEEIRPSLLDPACVGPDPVYGIAMDVGRREHAGDLRARGLLFGVMIFAAGRLGAEPVRTQGHVHQRPTAELYEVWSGRAIVLMQERDGDDPGRCFAAEAGPGEHIVVPPGWAHATISADAADPLVFGAWCARDYGFVYDGVRRHGGLAWFVTWRGGRLCWEPNPRYRTSELTHAHAVDCSHLRIPIYSQYERDPECFQWIPNGEPDG